MQQPPHLRLVTDPPSTSSTSTSSSPSPTTIDDILAQFSRASVPAVTAPTVVVDPGQVVTVAAKLGNVPKVTFSSMAPGGPVRVDMLGTPGSRITDEGEGVFKASIDTRRMPGGDGWWYFLGEDPAAPEKQRAKLGQFTVRAAPPELLGVETKWKVPWWGYALGGAALALVLVR